MDSTIAFTPAQPCGTADGPKVCGKPATVGILYLTISGLMFMPVCAECTAAVAKLYQIIDLADELRAEKEVGNDGSA
jgi:hypothetical protein